MVQEGLKWGSLKWGVEYNTEDPGRYIATVFLLCSLGSLLWGPQSIPFSSRSRIRITMVFCGSEHVHVYICILHMYMHIYICMYIQKIYVCMYATANDMDGEAILRWTQDSMQGLCYVPC